MRRIVTVGLFLSLLLPCFGQGLTIETGGHMVVSGNAAIVVNDGSFINNGNFNRGSGTLYMKGSVSSANSVIGGTSILSFQNIAIEKSSNGVQLNTSINVDGNLQMNGGDLDLNGKSVNMFFGADIQNETEANRIWGDSGEIVLLTNHGIPTNVNPASLGLTLTSSSNLGTFTIRRIHQNPMINGGTGIGRQYKISYFNTGLDVDYQFEYLDAELNGIDEAYLNPWKFQGDWQQVTPTSKDAGTNTIVVNGANTTGDTLWAFSSGQLLVTPKVFLEGNYSAGLMTDNLRANGLIPNTEPYSSLGFAQVNSGGETIDPAILNTTGSDAIVDWIFLEIRDPADSTSTIQTINALLQRDGDIVDLDGVSPVKIPNLGVNSYYVAIYHRNHLPIRSAGKLALTPSNSSYDFSTALTQVWTSPTISSNDAMKDLGGGVYGMIGGDVNGNRNVRATGPPFINDFSNLLSTLGGSTNILTSQYSRADMNMDGTVRATGPPFINDFSKLLTILGTSTTILNAHID